MLYEVNTKRIEEQLAYLARCLLLCEQLKNRTLHDLEEFAMARSLQIAVECIIDVGSVMIDGFIMRDPGGYQDIIDILEDEQVISPDLASTIRKWVKLRERLVRHYTDVRQEELIIAVKEASHVHSFIQSVHNYLDKELRSGNGVE